MREHDNETEILTVNVGYVDLGRIDLLVQDGFFSNRSEFIGTAIRQELTNNSGATTRTMDRPMTASANGHRPSPASPTGSSLPTNLFQTLSRNTS